MDDSPAPHEDLSRPAPGLIPPHVDAVGVTHYPDDFRGTPRTYSKGARAFVWSLIVIFAAITVFTTVASLGAYCLTSDGGDTRALHSSPFFDESPAD